MRLVVWPKLCGECVVGVGRLDREEAGEALAAAPADDEIDAGGDAGADEFLERRALRGGGAVADRLADVPLPAVVHEEVHAEALAVARLGEWDQFFGEGDGVRVADDLDGRASGDRLFREADARRRKGELLLGGAVGVLVGEAVDAHLLDARPLAVLEHLEADLQPRTVA